jgi:hypothetical protein
LRIHCKERVKERRKEKGDRKRVVAASSVAYKRYLRPICLCSLTKITCWSNAIVRNIDFSNIAQFIQGIVEEQVYANDC